jgi:predicted nuclease of predicted toxin-antitoxin system
LRFLIDESLPSDLAADLVTAGHEVLEVADSEHRGEGDSVIWRVAIAEDRILVARDLDFPLPKALGRPPGLVVVRPRWAVHDPRRAAGSRVPTGRGRG